MLSKSECRDISTFEAPARAFDTKDTGRREQTVTGSLRERAPGKGRFDQVAPLALRRLAELYERGHWKYGDGRNWEKGQPIAWFLDSAQRHLNSVLAGEVDEDHLAAVAWNVFCVMEYEERARLGMEPYVAIMREADEEMGPLWRYHRIRGAGEYGCDAVEAIAGALDVGLQRGQRGSGADIKKSGDSPSDR